MDRKTNAIGIKTTAGGYGGTYVYEDLAFVDDDRFY